MGLHIHVNSRTQSTTVNTHVLERVATINGSSVALAGRDAAIAITVTTRYDSGCRDKERKNKEESRGTSEHVKWVKHSDDARSSCWAEAPRSLEHSFLYNTSLLVVPIYGKSTLTLANARRQLFALFRDARLRSGTWQTGWTGVALLQLLAQPRRASFYFLVRWGGHFMPSVLLNTGRPPPLHHWV